MNPMLLRGHKFDVRLYVFVAATSPLVAYLHDEGVVRVAGSPSPPQTPTPPHLPSAWTRTVPNGLVMLI